MSEVNMRLARALFPEGEFDLVAVLTDRKRVAAMAELVHPDFESVFESRNVPMGPANIEDGSGARQPTAYGLEGFLRAWGDWLSVWETWIVSPNRFVEVDDERVLVLMEVRARSKTHGVEMPIEPGILLTIRGGKLARWETYMDQADALEVAGLE
jgi:hypothetical protein